MDDTKRVAARSSMASIMQAVSEAEKRAKQIVEDAKAQAAIISSAQSQELDDAINENSIKLKRHAESAKKQAEERGEAEAAVYLKQAEAEIERMRLAANENLNAAADEIIKQFLKLVD